MDIKEFIIGVIVFLVLLSFSSLFAYFGPITKQCEIFEERDKDICLMKLAKQNEDASLCQNIQDHILGDMCIHKIWERDNCIYWNIIGENKDNCILSKLDAHNLKICYDLKEPGNFEECTRFYFNKSLSENDLSFCSGDSHCMFFYIIEKNDPHKCELLKEIDAQHYKLCNTFFKIKNPDALSCKNDDCFILDYSLEYKKCEKEEDMHNNPFCLAINAINSGDPTICLLDDEPLTTKRLMEKNFCLTAVAAESKDINHCNLIGFECNENIECTTYLENIKNLCFYSVTKDPAFCKKNNLCFDWCNRFKEDSFKKEHSFYSYEVCLNLIDNPTFKSLGYTSILKALIFHTIDD